MDKFRLIDLALAEAFLPGDSRPLGDFLAHEEDARLAGEAAPASRRQARAEPASLLSPMSAVRALDHAAGL